MKKSRYFLSWIFWVKIKIMLGCLSLCACVSSHAYLAELTRNSVQDLTRNEKPVAVDESKAEEASTPPVENKPIQTNTSPALKPQVKQDTTAQPPAQTPKVSDQAVTRIQPSYYNPNNITAQKPQGTAGQGVNVERLMAYIDSASNIIKSDRYKADGSAHHTALLVLHGSLLSIGSEALSGMVSVESQRELAKAIGCVNTYRSERLSRSATEIINQHSSMVSIGGVLQSAPKINSSYTHKCL